jgi:hypothetical protein
MLVAAVSACSSSSSTSSPSSATTAATPTTATTAPTTTASGAPASSGASGSAAAVAEVKANWAKFFSSSTSNSERVALLENGSQFASTIASFSASPFAAAVTSKVDTVAFTSATKAKVTYDLSAMGSTVASGQPGSSVLQSGTWKVSDESFCNLLKQGASELQIKVPAACGSAG